MLKKGIILLTFVLLQFFFRWGFWGCEVFSFFSSDDSIPYLMSLHISKGMDFPIFFYGQFYHGAFASYFYAFLMSIVGFSVRNLVIINILLFSLGCVFLSKIFKDSYNSLFYFIIPIPALLFISTDTSVYFPFVFLFSSYFIWTFSKLEYNFSLKRLIFASFLAGLFFWIYQGSLIILVPFFLFSIVKLIKSSKSLSFETIKSMFLIGLSFLIGLLPLIYSEFRNNFVSSKFTFMNSGSIPSIKDFIYWTYNFFKLPAYNHYFKSSIYLKLDDCICYTITLLTFLGFLFFIIYTLKKKKSLWLIFFSVASVILISFSSFGKIIAENMGSRARYEVHSMILMPLSLLFFVFILKKIDIFLCRYIFKNKIRVPIFLFIFIAILFKLNISVNKYSIKGGRENNNLCAELIRTERPTLYFGNYTKYFKYNSITKEKKLFVPLPFAPADISFFSNVRYYPYTLKTFSLWQDEKFGFITDLSSGEKIKNSIYKIFPTLNFEYLKIKKHSIFVFPPKTPIEILLINKYPYLYKYVRRLAEASVKKIVSDDNIIKIFFKKDSKWGGNRRLELKNGNKIIEFPLHKLAVNFRVNAGVKKNSYEIIYNNLSLRIKENGFVNLGSETLPGVEFNHYSDAFNMVYFDFNKRKIFNIDGIPIYTDFSIKVNSEKIKAIEIEMYNPFNFESDLWQKKFKQEILLNSTNNKKIFLKNGKNLIHFSVKKGESLKLEPKYKTFFKVTDLSFATYFKPVGVLITKILITNNYGKKRDVTPLLRNDFLEKRKSNVKKRFKK